MYKNLNNNGIKYFGVAFLWLAMGLLCSVAALYSFTNGVSRLIMPVTNHLIASHRSKFAMAMADLILFHIADYFCVLIFALILSATTGKKLFWFIAFIAGTLALPFYALTIYLNQQATSAHFPDSVIQIIITRFFIIPLVAWVGIILGNKYRRTRQNTPKGFI